MPLRMASIRVTARMMGPLKEALGRAEEEIFLGEGSRVSDAVNSLVAKTGDLEEALIDAQIGSPLVKALILLNGVEVGNLKGTETPLRDGDTLVFLSVTHGG